MATAAPMFRVCPRSGLQFHKSAETLIKLNAVAAVVALLVGGVLALLITLTRWQAIHLIDADNFYLFLTAHGLDMLVVWIIFFEIAILYFCSSTLLRCRLATPRIAWLGFALMVIGTITFNVAIFTGNATVMMTSYVPMPAHPAFYLGLILFAVGALIGCFVFLGTLVVAKAEKTYEGSVPLVTFGALTACIIAIFTIASGAIILIPTWLWSIGYISHIDPAMYRVIWWAFGHSSQQINVSAHVAVWYAIAAIVFGARPMSERISRTAFLLYICFLQLASAHHILADPAVGTEWKIFNTSYAMYLAVLASMIHGLTVPGAIEVAQREKGYTKGLFEWLRKAPWGNPVFSGMFISLIGFGFLGGISGVMMGTEQLNMIIHNTIYVPGHFHATVVIGTTLAFMSMTYFLLPTLFNREMILPGWAKWQPYVFGLGMGVFTLAMMGAGTLGVPRRHWDITFAGAALPYEFPGAALLMIAIFGVAGVIAVIGGAMYIIITVGTLLFGKKLDAGAYTHKVDPLRLPMQAALSGHGGHGGGFAAPGTFVFALVFLVAFILYYFVNWKYLSTVWGLS
ncbi:cbb3-type cytochrome c oxidase subunit I [Quisquiliibacterium transsilvanicum]|uniref:Cytochrome c oxidase subunit 1 n=1 Tax=Quisquiliibacterium transsilvanicum TaxID=1549638 RepID=A0A7W8M8C7_9BURK|nr:cbb3-type cytochrome c oxidase subunit I [Quisquiliibacterium transsilvanicum]MBB5271135.1 cytochrome c oxidase subunit 1 [Quisquiliibacterium transsilvanicum]